MQDQRLSFANEDKDVHLKVQHLKTVQVYIKIGHIKAFVLLALLATNALLMEEVSLIRKLHAIQLLQYLEPSNHIIVQIME